MSTTGTSGTAEPQTDRANDPAADRRPIGYWLKLVDRLIDESFTDVFQSTGLTRRHWQVLNLIRDGVSDTPTIDRALSPFSPSGEGRDGQGPRAVGVSAEIADLRARGWIAQDGTGWEVTVAGRQAHHDLLDAVSTSRDRLAEGVTSEDYARTIATLERMARNLGWSPGT